MKKFAMFLVLLAGLGQCWAEPQTVAQPQTDSRIVGSWVVTITSPANEFPPLKGTYSFTQDGVLIATDVGQISSPPSTAGQGAWKSTGHQKFSIKWINFATDAGGNLDGQGLLTATLKVSNDGDSFTGAARFVAFDNDGNVVFSADEILQGSRIRP